MDKYIVLKDYLNLKENDLITVSHDMDNNIYFEVSNRYVNRHFYGNSLGKWSYHNRKSKNDPLFIIIKAKLEPFTGIKFKISSPPIDVNKELTLMYNNHTWFKMEKERIINDLILLNIIKLDEN